MDRSRSLATLVLLLCSGLAAAAPIGTLEWIDRTGTVSGTETIPVSFRLTMNDDSVPLILDSGVPGAPISGLEQDDLDTLESEFPGFEILNSYLSHFFQCGSTFNSSCIDPPPYRFAFSGQFPHYDVNLQPGMTYDLAHGEFIPSPSPAPAGTYNYFNAGIFLAVAGFYPNSAYDPNDPGDVPEFLDFERWFYIAQIGCGTADVSCSFERTVEREVPAPAGLALLGLGLGMVTAVRRKRRRIDLRPLPAGR